MNNAAKLGVSLVCTVVLYGAGPLFFALWKRRPISVSQLVRFSIIYTLIIWICANAVRVFLLQGDISSGGAALFWGVIFHYGLKKYLQKNKLLLSEDQVPTAHDPIRNFDNIKIPSLRARAQLYNQSAETLCQNGEPNDGYFCPKCGRRVRSGEMCDCEECGRDPEGVGAPKTAAQKHSRPVIALTVLCVILAITICVIGYESHMNRKIAAAFVQVNAELLEENKALKAELEDQGTAQPDVAAQVNADQTDSRTENMLREKWPYVASVNSNKYHRKDCEYADAIYPENRVYYETKADAEQDFKEPCAVCRP